VLLATAGSTNGTPATTSSANSAIPVQHLLIPVSVGNGLQQLISIPLSLAAGAGNHIQLLATSSGQLIAANMAAALQQPTASQAIGKLHSLLRFYAYLHDYSTLIVFVVRSYVDKLKQRVNSESRSY